MSMRIAEARAAMGLVFSIVSSLLGVFISVWVIGGQTGPTEH